jgi:glutaconyl-CoA/methylmalonyl-CoA decarboxylase subunit gamma
MKYKVTLNNIVYEIEVEHGEARMINEYEAAPAVVQAPVMQAAPAAPAPAPAPAAKAAPAPKAAPAATAGTESVKAPLPGTILSIKVTNGQEVKAGQVLLILEAMKMENEIVAPRAGTILQIATAQGASVNTGDLLAVLK